MKILEKLGGPKQSQPVRRTGSSKSADKTTGKSSYGRAGTADKVSVSSGVAGLSQAIKAAASEPVVGASDERIEELRLAIKSGSYAVDADALADAIVERDVLGEGFGEDF